MDTLQAILLGIVQGITEFLPVSSSGHLQIAKEGLGVELGNKIPLGPDPGHLGPVSIDALPIIFALNFLQ